VHTITAAERAVIAYVFSVRFATAAQVRRRFPLVLPSLRTTQRRLARLVQLGHLAVAPVRSTSPNFPLVYYVTSLGIRTAVRAAPEDESPIVPTEGEDARRRGYSSQMILHELFLTEFDLGLWETIRDRSDLEVLGTERRYFRRDRQLVFPYQGTKKQVIPDYGFLIRLRRADAGTGLLLTLVEVDNGTMSLARMREKFQHYDLWAKSDHGQEYLRALYRRHGAANPQPIFRLAVIAHDKAGTVGDDHRLCNLYIQALDLPTSLRDRMWFTTVADLRAHATAPKPLEAMIWVRGRDAGAWASEYQAFSAALPRGRGHRVFERLQAFVTNRLARMQRHSFFPPALPILAQPGGVL